MKFLKIFRKAGLILVLVIASGVAAAMYFVTYSFIQEQLEKQLSIQNGALVEFSNLKIDFFGGKMAWNKLQIADPENPMQNRLETAQTTVSIQAWKLLQKKMILDELTLSEIKTGTERSKSGELPKDWIPVEEEEEVDSGDSALLKEAGELTKQAKRDMMNSVKQAPVFQLANTSINTDSILAMVKLESPKKIDSLKTDITNRVNAVTQTVDNLKLEQTVKETEVKIKTINIKELKDIQAIESTYKTLDELSKTATELKSNLTTAQKTITDNVKTVTSGIKDVDDWIKSDYENARKVAKLPDFDTQQIGEMLLGKELLSQIQSYLDYAKTARTYLAYFKSDDDAQEKDETPQRGRGQDIRYPLYEPNPDVWIKTVHLSYVTENEIHLEGDIKDIISNQKMIKRPTTVVMKGVNKNNENMDINGEFNYLETKPRETFQFAMPKMSLRTLDLGTGGSLPSGFSKGNAQVEAQLNIVGGAPTATISMVNTGIGFKFNKKPGNKAETVFQDVMNRIDQFKVDAKISSNAKGLKVNISSDIDKQVSRQIKAVANEEVEKVKQQIKAKVDAQVNAKKQELNNLVNQQKQRLESKKKEIEDKVNAQIQKIEDLKKELENKKNDLLNQAKAKADELKAKAEAEAKKKADEAKKKAEEEAKKAADKLKSKVKIKI